MKSKTYIKITLSVLFAAIIIVAGIQIAIDPLFQYHTPWFDMKPVITDERYQDAGVARNFDFDNAIIGNSLSQNFKVSDVSKAFGGETVKLTASGSHTIDWTYVLDVLKSRSSTPKNILFNMDPYIFQASNTELKHDLPKYLYDNDYLNDVNYLFNFSIINSYTFDAVKSNLSGMIPDYVSFMLWDDDFEYGKDFVLNHYTRPEISTESPDIEEYKKTVAGNLELLLPYIEEMQDTQFVFFFSPFSMLYWDAQTRENAVDKQKAGYMTACEILSKYDNVTLYLWADIEMFGVMGNLENYVDDAHYSPEICEMMADRIGKKQGIVTADTYESEINILFDYIKSYNYDSLFE